MKNVKNGKKLQLNRQTLRALNTDELALVAGGEGGKKKDTVWDCGLKTTMCASSPLACLTKDGGTLCGPIVKK